MVPEDMAIIRKQAMRNVPGDFVVIAEELREAAWSRVGTYGRVGYCTEILSLQEYSEYSAM